MEGTPFGRYRLLELLGAGAMGEVHRAYDTGTDRLVAVKVLAPEFIHNAKYRKRFQREAQVAARLTEPHIVPIHDFGEIDGRLYLEMRLVQAPNLATLLAERDRLEPNAAVEVLTQIAAALDAAHAEGLVHRDVKPSNILLTPEGFAYLIDFGIARSDEDSTLTTTGMLIGTFAYMAPERLAEDESGARSDVYSLACVFYECLAGVKPYPGESVQRQIAAHLTDRPPLPSAAGVPSSLDAVIAQGMAKDPEQRYQSAGALAAAARAALLAPANPPNEATAPNEPREPDASHGAGEPEPANGPNASGGPNARNLPSGPNRPDEPSGLPWRAVLAAAVLLLGAAGVATTIVVARDAALVKDAPGPTVSVIDPTTTSVPAPPDGSLTPHLPHRPPSFPASPAISVTASIPAVPPVSGTETAEYPPTAQPDEPPPDEPPPPVTSTPTPSSTTTTPTTTEPTPTETTPTETTSTATPTSETTTSEPPETTTTATDEEAAGSVSGADATGSEIATISAPAPGTGINGGTGTEPSPPPPTTG